MPELPEVEVLRRHLNPILTNKKIVGVEVLKLRTIRTESQSYIQDAIVGCTIKNVGRKGKFLELELVGSESLLTLSLIIHLGMTGRLFLQNSSELFPKHVAMVFLLGEEYLVFKDPRSFGRVSINNSIIKNLGVDAYSSDFTEDVLASVFQNTKQSVKDRLMNQKFIAGLGNIYACEVLYMSRISPFVSGSSLSFQQVKTLYENINSILHEQVRFGLGLDLDFSGESKSDGLFYYGSKSGHRGQIKEQFKIYGREGIVCSICNSLIQRTSQSNRSTYYCPKCQS